MRPITASGPTSHVVKARDIDALSHRGVKERRAIMGHLGSNDHR